MDNIISQLANRLQRKLMAQQNRWWELKLIDSEDILESNPPQRNLRLSLKNEESCLAYITKELTFDISNLQVNGNKVQLNLTNSDKNILYKY